MKSSKKPRLPKEALQIIRKRGGVHRPKKGGRYKRAEAKKTARREIKTGF